MHFISDRSLMRDNYAYSELPNGGWVGYPVDLGSRDKPIPERPSILMRLAHLLGRKD